MNEDRNQEPGRRLRTILSSADDETSAEPTSQDKPRPPSPLSRLPQRKPSTPAVTPPPSAQAAPLSAVQAAPSRARTETPPPAHPLESSPQAISASQGRDPNEKARAARQWKFGPAFWTITGIMSLILNAVLIAMLLVMYNMLGQLQGMQGTATNIGSSILGGLYTNFEKMDRSTIKTTIPVDAQIPLNLSVPVQTTTQITLADSVSIPNAQVVINTGGLNINSNARVTLPAGTPMMVNLNFTLPVQTTIPVHLDVPVNIPMNQTELHDPFVGLQDVVRPWYCLVEPDASNLDGQLICR